MKTSKTWAACAFAAFLAVWFALKWIVNPTGNLPLHLLMVAYFAHLLVRTVWLAFSWKAIRDR